MESVKVRLDREEVAQMTELRKLWFDTHGIKLSASAFVAAIYRLGLRQSLSEAPNEAPKLFSAG